MNSTTQLTQEQKIESYDPEIYINKKSEVFKEVKLLNRQRR